MKRTLILLSLALLLLVSSCATKAVAPAPLPENVEAEVQPVAAPQVPSAKSGYTPAAERVQVPKTFPVSTLAPLGLPGMGGILTMVDEYEGHGLKGIIITTETHEHNTYLPIEELVELGFGNANFYNEFYLNEWFSLYAYADDLDDEITVYFIKHEDGVDYRGMLPVLIEAKSFNQGTPILWDAVPDENDYCYLGSTYIPSWCGPGVYDVIFCIYSEMLYVTQFNII